MPRRLDDWLHDRRAGAASATDEEVVVLGEVHDDRFAASVTLSPTEVIVTLDGELDRVAAPVLAEVLDAAERWVQRNGPRPGWALQAPDPASEGDDTPHRKASWAGPTDADGPGTALFLDARNVEFIDVPTLELLAVRRDRWEVAHGPGVLLVSDEAQRIWSLAATHVDQAPFPVAERLDEA